MSLIMYEDIYFMLSYWLFQSYGHDLSSHQDLVITFLSAIFVLFVLALPFMLVWWIIKRFL